MQHLFFSNSFFSKTQGDLGFWNSDFYITLNASLINNFYISGSLEGAHETVKNFEGKHI